MPRVEALCHGLQRVATILAATMIQVFLAKYCYPEPLGQWEWRVQYIGNSELEAQLIFNSLPKGERWWDDVPDGPVVVDDDDDDDDDDDSTVVYDADLAMADWEAGYAD